MKSLNSMLPGVKLACLVALGLPALAACSEEELPETPDTAGSFLRDHEWEYLETRMKLKDGGALPFPSDPALLEELRNEEGTPLPGDALTGSEFIFEVDGSVLVRPLGFLDYESFEASYKVVDDSTFRMSVGQQLGFKYEYVYDRAQGSLVVSPEVSASGAISGLLNDVFLKTLVSGPDDSAATRMTALLFNDPRVQGALADYLDDGIRGKLDPIPEEDAEDRARTIAQASRELLGEAELTATLEAALNSRLTALADADPEATAELMAAHIVAQVSAELSPTNIEVAVLPHLQEVEGRDAKEVSSLLARTIHELVNTLLAEERPSGIVESAWREYSEVPHEAVGDIASELATLFIDNGLNAEQFSALILPQAALIETTDADDVPALADQALSSLVPLVDELNALFPELALSPPWTAVRAALREAFVAAKEANTNDAQSVADDTGATIAAEFFTQEQMEGSTLSALLAIEGADPADAGAILGAWLASVIDAPEDAIVASLAARLESKIGELEVAHAADVVGALLSENLASAYSEEALNAHLEPLVEEMTAIDPEESAAFLVEMLSQADLLSPDLEEDELSDVVTGILAELFPLGENERAERLVQLVLDAGLITDEVSEERGENVLRFVLYRSVLELAQNLDKVERIEIELARPD